MNPHASVAMPFGIKRCHGAGPSTDERYARDAGMASLFERGALRLVCTALACRVYKVLFAGLWSGEGGDGSGGTAHSYREAVRRIGWVAWLDTRTSW